MTLKRPLCSYSGQLEELHVGDTLVGVTGGSSGGVASTSVVFNAEATVASTLAVSATWVTATSILLCSVFDSEDALVQDITAYATNIVAGVGFDVVAAAPDGATGTYTVQIVGV